MKSFKIFKSLSSVIALFGSNDSVKKGCLKASSAFILYCFFGSNKRRIKSLQFLLTFLKGAGVKSYLHFFIFSNISSSVSPKKGGTPLNKMYIKTPQDHSSLLSSYKLSTTSGEQYILVPIIPLSFFFFLFRRTKYLEHPKSINFIS